MSPPPPPVIETDADTSSSAGSLWKVGLENAAATTTTVPAATSGPATVPPTICACGPAREIERLAAAAGDTSAIAGGRNVPVMDRISNRPRNTIVAGAPAGWGTRPRCGWRSVTFATAPMPERTQMPRFRRWENLASESATSCPAGISST
ncbi:hypothetical protein C4D60_Mb10t01410 [Musa balbisiana]|uniref:Uncharacterized protein n=1 Tax=Musa balbisiana TaxID=52838 RepID=A0A4S8ITX2_MUSBA|nr:hypothetical protein C4D60_Mb10t01410 [Musa balbisiana]